MHSIAWWTFQSFGPGDAADRHSPACPSRRALPARSHHDMSSSPGHDDGGYILPASPSVSPSSTPATFLPTRGLSARDGRTRTRGTTFRPRPSLSSCPTRPAPRRHPAGPPSCPPVPPSHRPRPPTCGPARTNARTKPTPERSGHSIYSRPTYLPPAVHGHAALRAAPRPVLSVVARGPREDRPRTAGAGAGGKGRGRSTEPTEAGLGSD